MKKSTVSISEGGRPAWVTQGDPVVGLRMLGTTTTFDFGALERLTIGTADERDLVLDDPTVSALHCVIEREDGVVLLQDWRSRNGSYVNGLRCQRVELRDGSIVTLGRTHLVAYSEANRQRKTAREQLVGGDPRFLSAVTDAERAAFEGRNVLIIGERGTGKTLLAQVIHEIARGPSLPFVTVDCAEDSAAATAALFSDAPTAVDRAAGGTLFLKEPGALSERNVHRLLDALRAHAASEPASVRLVATTTALSPTVQSYQALAPMIVELPPLRDRRGDLAALATAFITDHLGPRAARLSPTTLAALNRHTWPGNVAELREALRRLVALGTSPSLTRASQSLDIPRSNLTRWLDRHGLPRTKSAGYLW